MKKKQPLISILLPVYNGEKYILNAIRSVLNQTHENIELLIADDCSTDKTDKIIKNIKDSRVSYFRREKRMGYPYLADLASMANGDYITNTNHDDLYIPTAFETFMTYFSEDPTIEVVMGRQYPIDEDGHVKPFDGDLAYAAESPIRKQQEILPWLFSFFAMTSHRIMRRDTWINHQQYFTGPFPVQHSIEYSWAIPLLLFTKVKVINEFTYLFMQRDDAWGNREKRPDVVYRVLQLISQHRRFLSIEDIYPSIGRSRNETEKKAITSECYLQLAKYMLHMPARASINLDLVELDLERALDRNPSSTEAFRLLNLVRFRKACIYAKLVLNGSRIGLFDTECLQALMKLDSFNSTDSVLKENGMLGLHSTVAQEKQAIIHATEWEHLERNEPPWKTDSNPEQQYSEYNLKNKPISSDKGRILIVSSFYPPHHINVEQNLIEKSYFELRSAEFDTMVLTSDFLCHSYRLRGLSSCPDPDLHRKLKLDYIENFPYQFDSDAKLVQANNEKIISIFLDQYKPDYVILWDTKNLCIEKKQFYHFEGKVLEKSKILSAINSSNSKDEIETILRSLFRTGVLPSIENLASG